MPFLAWIVVFVLIFVCLGFVGVETPLTPDEHVVDERVVFLALGDQGAGDWRQWQVARAMERVAQREDKVHFTLLLGDNFYPDGVASTKDPQWLEKFERVYAGPGLRSMPFLAILGNHDYLSNPRAQVARSRVPNPRGGPGRWQMDGFYYVRDFGKAYGRTLLRLVALDTNGDADSRAAQVAMIRQSFGRSDDSPVWKVAAGHHPIRSIGPHGPTKALNDWLLPALKETGTDLYLAGHDHNQQVIQAPDEPLYVISGGGGKKLYELKRWTPWVRFAAKQFGFVKATVERTRLSISVFGENAGLSYAMTLEKP